ncbi:MAG: hypothetical protein LBR80_14575 [Deltaproteobacteria bacterium]|nr:hypothetical protein [Deltaproteobacteria bacterium]
MPTALTVRSWEVASMMPPLNWRPLWSFRVRFIAGTDRLAVTNLDSPPVNVSVVPVPDARVRDFAIVTRSKVSTSADPPEAASESPPEITTSPPTLRVSVPRVPPEPGEDASSEPPPGLVPTESAPSAVRFSATVTVTSPPLSEAPSALPPRRTVLALPSD